MPVVDIQEVAEEETEVAVEQYVEDESLSESKKEAQEDGE